MRRLILLFLSFPSAFCLIGGESVEWKDFPYLVKVAASVEDGNHLGCTGVLVNPTLVFTSSRCFPDREGRSDYDAIVISIRGNGTRNWKRETVSVKKSKDFAILTLQSKLRDNNPCSDGIPLIERLPIASNQLSLPPIEEIPKSICRVIGFKTVEVSDYSTNNDVLELPVSLEINDKDMLIAKVEPGQGPCFDDYGAPLECMLDGKVFSLVGIIHSVSRDESDSKPSTTDPLEICNTLNQMQFTPLTDGQHLMKLWKKQFPDILTVQGECFNGDDEE